MLGLTYDKKFHLKPFGFKCYLYIHGSLAQLVEHLTFNQGVPGSNPGWATKTKTPKFMLWGLKLYADVVKLAYTIDLGSIAERLGGSSPFIRTKSKKSEGSFFHICKWSDSLKYVTLANIIARYSVANSCSLQVPSSAPNQKRAKALFFMFANERNGLNDERDRLNWVLIWCNFAIIISLI